MYLRRRVFGGAVPKNYFPAVEKGIQECVLKGPLAGYPVVGLKATLLDGSYHPVDSSELAFKMAAIHGLQEGLYGCQSGTSGADCLSEGDGAG